MDNNSLIVWWLLAVPIVLAIVDRFMTPGGRTAGAGTADGYINRQGAAPSSTANPSTVRAM